MRRRVQYVFATFVAILGKRRMKQTWPVRKTTDRKFSPRWLLLDGSRLKARSMGTPTYLETVMRAHPLSDGSRSQSQMIWNNAPLGGLSWEPCGSRAHSGESLSVTSRFSIVARIDSGTFFLIAANSVYITLLLICKDYCAFTRSRYQQAMYCVGSPDAREGHSWYNLFYSTGYLCLVCALSPYEQHCTHVFLSLSFHLVGVLFARVMHQGDRSFGAWISSACGVSFCVLRFGESRAVWDSYSRVGRLFFYPTAPTRCA